MDYISFCCDYAEYENLQQFQNDYGEEYKTIEDIEEKTTVIKMGKGAFIVQQF